MNVKYLLLIAMILINVLILVEVFHIINKMRYNNKKIELERYKIELDSKIDQSTSNLLDTIIIEAFQAYMVKNAQYKQMKYINAETEAKIRKDVADDVSNLISPTLLTKLSTIYNINSIGFIIGDKVYMQVLQYVIENNKVKDDGHQIEKIN